MKNQDETFHALVVAPQTFGDIDTQEVGHQNGRAKKQNRFGNPGHFRPVFRRNYAKHGVKPEQNLNQNVNSSTLGPWKGIVKVHMTLHDLDGKSAVFEYLDGKLVITRKRLRRLFADQRDI